MRRLRFVVLAFMTVLSSACWTDQKTIVELDDHTDSQIQAIFVFGPSGPVQLPCTSTGASGSVSFTFSAQAFGVGDIDQEFTWSSGGVGSWNGSTWTINQPGTYTITATHGVDYSKKKDITVVVIGCTVIPNNVVVSPGTLSLQAPGTNCTNTTGHLSANVPVTWSSSNPSVASVTSTSSTTATVTAHAAGSATITATPVSGNGQPGYANVTVASCVTVPPTQVLTSIDYEPQDQTYQVGHKQQLYPTCKDQSGNVMNCPTLTWVSTNPSIVHVSSSGLITCVSPGSAQVSVQTPNGGPSNRHTFTCVQSQTVTFTINPNSLNLWGTECPARGPSTGQLQLLRNGVPVTTGITWTSSNSSIASVSSSGVVTRHQSGSVTITATTAEGSATTNVVLNSCPVGTGTITGPTQVYAGQCTLSGPNTITLSYAVNGVSTQATWTSSNNAVASVSSNGVVTGYSVGQVTITATGGGTSATYTVTVNPCPVFQLDKTSATVNNCPAPNQQSTFFAATSGRIASAQVTSGSNLVTTTVNTSTNQVLVTPNSGVTGTATINIASTDGQTITVTVTVNSCPPPPSTACSITSIDYSPKGGTLGVNENRLITLDQVSNWPSNCDVIWTSDAPSKVQVNGADNVKQIDGLWFYSGLRASLRGIYNGSAQICGQVISIGSDGKWTRTGVSRCYTWTTVTASSNVEAQGVVSPIEMNYKDLDWVSQNFDSIKK